MMSSSGKSYLDHQGKSRFPQRLDSSTRVPYQSGMATESWDRRIARADHLASTNEASRELLVFYSNLLRAQKEIYEHLRGRKMWLPSGDLRQDLSVLLIELPAFLLTLESCAPPILAEQATRLSHQKDGEVHEMLLEYWRAPSDIQFFAKAFLQPYGQLLHDLRIAPANRDITGGDNRCPFCGAAPQLSFLHSTDASSEGGGRKLICAVCLNEWTFRRVICGNCLEEDPHKLGYFQSPLYDHVRIEVCETCKHYLKGIDLTRSGLASPLVDEVAAASLDVWAQENGYTKIELNLIGL
jgi:formate dehydrogenase maturation protein FdhE